MCEHCSSNQSTFRYHTSVRVGAQEISAYAAFAYSEEVRRAVHRLKFEGHPELARRAAVAMYEALPIELRTPLWWVPVPLERAQLVARGFNQSALLANELAHLTDGRSYPTLLQRNPGADKQSHLSRVERHANLAARFDLDVTTRPLPVGSIVVLVDDVLTTGATAIACCKVLHDCGYRVAAVVTLARVTGREPASLVDPADASRTSVDGSPASVGSSASKVRAWPTSAPRTVAESSVPFVRWPDAQYRVSVMKRLQADEALESRVTCIDDWS